MIDDCSIFLSKGDGLGDGERRVKNNSSSFVGGTDDAIMPLTRGIGGVEVYTDTYNGAVRTVAGECCFGEVADDDDDDDDRELDFISRELPDCSELSSSPVFIILIFLGCFDDLSLNKDSWGIVVVMKPPEEFSALDWSFSESRSH